MKKGNAINPIGVFTESLGYDAHGNYLLGGSMVLQEEEIDKVLFEGGLHGNPPEPHHLWLHCLPLQQGPPGQQPRGGGARRQRPAGDELLSLRRPLRRPQRRDGSLPTALQVQFFD